MPRASTAPGAVRLTAILGALGSDEGAALRAFHQVFDRARASAPPCRLAPRDLGANVAPDRLDPRRVFKAVPNDADQHDKNEQLSEAEAQHAALSPSLRRAAAPMRRCDGASQARS